MTTSVLRTALADALALVFPTWCAGCDEPDTPLCAACRAALVPGILTRRLDGLPVRSGLWFEGEVARVVRALKEQGRTGLARALAPALAAAIGAVAPETLIVPVPSSRAALRRRGYAVTTLLVRRAGYRAAPLLRTAGTAADQRGLRRAERADNVAGTFRAHRGAGGAAVILVDDVVTTGATLREAARTLTDAGAEVVAAATVASTRRTGRRTDSDTSIHTARGRDMNSSER